MSNAKKIEKKESTENILLEYGVKKDSGFFKLYIANPT